MILCAQILSAFVVQQKLRCERLFGCCREESLTSLGNMYGRLTMIATATRFIIAARLVLETNLRENPLSIYGRRQNDPPRQDPLQGWLV